MNKNNHLVRILEKILDKIIHSAIMR